MKTRINSKKKNKIDSKFTKINYNEINNLCNIEYSGNEPNDKSIILSCSLFKLNNMYRDITIYIDGLEDTINFINKLIKDTGLDIYIFLYYDNSVENDVKFIKLKNNSLKLPFIKLCKYYCPSFIKNELHQGVFGTLIRFLPFFQEKYNKNLKHVIDVDSLKGEQIYYYKYALPKVYHSHHNFVIFQKIGYEWKYANQYKNNFIDGTSLAAIYLKNITLPIHILTNFLKNLRDNNPQIKNIIKNMLIKKIELNKQGNKKETEIELQKYKKVDHLFIYGVDELFINKYVINYIIKKYRKIGIIYFSDNLKYYIKEMINWNKSPQKNIQLFLQKMLKNDYIENDKNFKKNINLLSNKIIMVNINSIKEYENKIKYLRYFYKTLLDYKKKLIIDSNYLLNLHKHFYTQYQLNFFMLNNSKLLDYVGSRIEIYEKYL